VTDVLARGIDKEFEPSAAGNDPREQIAGLEVRIQALAESAERCRKIILFSKAAIAVGSVSILLIVLFPIRLDPAVLVAAIAAVIGGIVGLGSNMRTLQQIRHAMAAAESLRAELIDGLATQIVDAPSV
jgi:hypothetical protein